MNDFARRIRPHVTAELREAEECGRRADPITAFAHLERAHVLGQASTREHVRVHFRMLIWSIRHRRLGELAGQVVRVIGAAALTPMGVVPIGNTGGANVSPWRRMAIPPDLAKVIADSNPIPVHRTR